MEGNDFTALLPLIIIGITSIIVLLQVSFVRSSIASFVLTCLGLLVAFGSLFISGAVSPREVTSLIVIDRYALFLMGLFFWATIAVAILGYSYLKMFDTDRSLFFIALLLAVLGSITLVASNNLVSLFLGLEILTISLYTMIAYLRPSDLPLEAGMKYLILAGASSAFLLFGIALIYAQAGTMNFQEISRIIAGVPFRHNLYSLAGIALFIVGLGFKLAVAPFHMWTPDVYEGAPAPVTAFVATISKGAVLGILLRFFLILGGANYPTVMLTIAIIAGTSMFVGNLLALLQKNVKRILAYSSISHLGYMLVALVAGGNLAVQAILYYLVIYFASILAALGIISIMADKDGEKMNIDDYRGLFWNRPGLAIAFSISLLSLAGIPFTAGFVGKFFIVIAGVGSALWALVTILIVNSAIGLYYYLRIMTAMYTQPEESELTPSPGLSFGGGAVLTVLTLAIVFFGVFPAPLLSLISKIITELTSYIAI
jgi:NADH-quinone oxidoreductase subunit N